MATDTVAKEFYESSKLAKYPFEPYWPAGKLRICVTGMLNGRSIFTLHASVWSSDLVQREYSHYYRRSHTR